MKTASSASSIPYDEFTLQSLPNSGVSAERGLGATIVYDEDFLAVSALDKDFEDGSGVVIVYEKSGGRWTVLCTITPPNANVVDWGFGTSLLFADQYLFVGSPYERYNGISGYGAVHIYQYNVGEPLMFSQTIILDYSDSETQFGHSLTFLKGFLFVGAPHYLTTGAVFWCEQDNTLIWTCATALVPTSPLVKSARFGFSLCSARSYVVVGAPGYESHPDTGFSIRGSVYIFQYSSQSNTVTETGYLPTGDEDANGNSAEFGYSVSMDDTILFVGAPGYDSNRGSVSFYRSSSFDYENYHILTSAPTGIRFGQSVFYRNFAEDGKTGTNGYALVGAPFANDGEGAVQVVWRSGVGLYRDATLTNPENSSNANVGVALAMDWSLSNIFVTAPGITLSDSQPTGVLLYTTFEIEFNVSEPCNTTGCLVTFTASGTIDDYLPDVLYTCDSGDGTVSYHEDSDSEGHFFVDKYYGSCTYTITVNDEEFSAIITQPDPQISSSTVVDCDTLFLRIFGFNFGLQGAPLKLLVDEYSFECTVDSAYDANCSAPRAGGALLTTLNLLSFSSEEFYIVYSAPQLTVDSEISPFGGTVTFNGRCLGNSTFSTTTVASVLGNEISVLMSDFDLLELNFEAPLSYRHYTLTVEVLGAPGINVSLTIENPRLSTVSPEEAPSIDATLYLTGTSFGESNQSVSFENSSLSLVYYGSISSPTSLELYATAIIGSLQSGLLCITDRCINVTLEISCAPAKLTTSELPLDTTSSVILIGDNFGLPAYHSVYLPSSNFREMVLVNHINSTHLVVNLGTILQPIETVPFQLCISDVCTSLSYVLSPPTIETVFPRVSSPTQRAYMITGKNLGCQLFTPIISLEATLISFSCMTANTIQAVLIGTTSTMLRVTRSSKSASFWFPLSDAYIKGVSDFQAHIDQNATVCSQLESDSPQWASSIDGFRQDCKVIDQYCSQCLLISHSPTAQLLIFFHTIDTYASFDARFFHVVETTLAIPNIAAQYNVTIVASGLFEEPVSQSSQLQIHSYTESSLSIGFSLTNDSSESHQAVIGNSRPFTVLSISTYNPFVVTNFCVVGFECYIIVDDILETTEFSDELTLLEYVDSSAILWVADVTSSIPISIVSHETTIAIDTVDSYELDVIFDICFKNDICIISIQTTLHDISQISFCMNGVNIEFVDFSASHFLDDTADNVCLTAVFGNNNITLKCVIPQPKPTVLAVSAQTAFVGATVQISLSSYPSNTHFCLASELCHFIDSELSCVVTSPTMELQICDSAVQISTLEFLIINSESFSVSPPYVTVGLANSLLVKGLPTNNPSFDCSIGFQTVYYTISANGSIVITPASIDPSNISLICCDEEVDLIEIAILPGPSPICTEPIELEDSFLVSTRQLDLSDTVLTSEFVNISSRCVPSTSISAELHFSRKVALFSLVVTIYPFCGECENSILIVSSTNSINLTQPYCLMGAEVDTTGICLFRMAEPLELSSFKLQVESGYISAIDPFGWIPEDTYRVELQFLPSILVNNIDSNFIVCPICLDYSDSLMNCTPTITYNNVVVNNSLVSFEQVSNDDIICASVFQYTTITDCAYLTVCEEELPLITNPEVFYADSIQFFFSGPITSISDGTLVSDRVVLFEFESISTETNKTLTYTVSQCERNLTLNAIIFLQLPEATICQIDSASITDTIMTINFTALSTELYFAQLKCEQCSISLQGTTSFALPICNSSSCYIEFDISVNFPPTTNISMVLNCSNAIGEFSILSSDCDSPFVAFEAECVCPAGYLQYELTCLPCSTGKYSSIAATSCVDCPLTFTSPQASTSIADCVCPTNYALVNDTCIDCEPLHFVCTGGQPIRTEDGYISLSFELLESVLCPIPSCSNSSCDDGYQDVDTLCTKCAPSTFLTSSLRCVPKTLSVYSQACIILSFSFAFFFFSPFYTLLATAAIGTLRAVMHSTTYSLQTAILLSFPSPFTYALMPIVIILSIFAFISMWLGYSWLAIAISTHTLALCGNNLLLALCVFPTLILFVYKKGPFGYTFEQKFVMSITSFSCLISSLLIRLPSLHFASQFACFTILIIFYSDTQCTKSPNNVFLIN